MAGNGLTALLAAAILDLVIVRPAPATPGSGSITTLLPGLVYACATVMKVCLVAGVLALVATLGKRAIGRIRGARPVPSPSRDPVWALASIALAPSATLTGAVAAVVAQRIALTTDPVSMELLRQIAPASVISMIVVLSAGIGAAVASLVRREKPVAIPALGLAVNTLLIALFCYLRFHAPGFDQDTWAP